MNTLIYIIGKTQERQMSLSALSQQGNSRVMDQQPQKTPQREKLFVSGCLRMA